VHFVSVPDPGRKVFSAICDVPEWGRRWVNYIAVTIFIPHSEDGIPLQHAGGLSFIACSQREQSSLF
jgi:hypothetical protein